MERPPAPNWNTPDASPQPQDEFFGFAPGSAEATPGEHNTDTKPGLIGKVLGTLVEQAPGRSSHGNKEDLRELQELQDLQPEVEAPSQMAAAGDISVHIKRLGTAQEKLRESFLAAESSSSLFEDIQRSQRKRYRTATWSLWIVSFAFAWLGYQYGKTYLQDITASGLASEGWLVDLMGGQFAYMLSVMSGLLGPIALFWAGVLGLHLVLGGIVENRPARVILAVSGLSVAALAFLQLDTMATFSMLLISLAAVALMRLGEQLLIRLGWY